MEPNRGGLVIPVGGANGQRKWQMSSLPARKIYFLFPGERVPHSARATVRKSSRTDDVHLLRSRPDQTGLKCLSRSFCLSLSLFLCLVERRGANAKRRKRKRTNKREEFSSRHTSPKFCPRARSISRLTVKFATRR